MDVAGACKLLQDAAANPESSDPSAPWRSGSFRSQMGAPKLYRLQYDNPSSLNCRKTQIRFRERNGLYRSPRRPWALVFVTTAPIHVTPLSDFMFVCVCVMVVAGVGCQLELARFV